MHPKQERSDYFLVVSLLRHLGWQSVVLTYNSTVGSWEFRKLLTKSIIAHTNVTEDYPLGVRTWYFPSKPPGGKEREKLLSLSVCGDNEYSCYNGECIPMEAKCDNEINCEDRSDKGKSCETIQFPEFYDTGKPPPNLKRQYALAHS